MPPRICVHREVDNMGKYGGPFTTWAGRCTSSRRRPGRLENYSVRDLPLVPWNLIESMRSALSEIMDHALPYDDVLALRDRMWELSPSLVRYDTLEHTSTDIALAGLKVLAVHTASATVSGAPFLKPIANFYQTDPISRAYVFPSFLFIPPLNLTMVYAGPPGR